MKNTQHVYVFGLISISSLIVVYYYNFLPNNDQSDVLNILSSIQFTNGSVSSSKQPSFSTAMYQLQYDQTDMDDSCTFDGRSDWIQYLYWITQKSHKKVKSLRIQSLFKLQHSSSKYLKSVNRSRKKLSDYKYNIIEKTVNLSELFFTHTLLINELVKNSSSLGGSSFRVEIKNKDIKVICPVKDYFNGHYLSCCTLDNASRGSPYSVEIYLQFVQYQAFERVKGQNHLIWRKAFEPEIVHKNLASLPYTNCTNINAIQLSQSYWVKRDAKYELLIPDQHCVMPRIGREEFQSCLVNKYNDTFHVIGDSHLRHVFYYLDLHLTGLYHGKRTKEDIALK